MSIFSSIPVKKPKLVPHNLSHNVTFSTQYGRLTPCLCEKVLPGDIFPVQVLHQEQFAPLSTKLFQDFRIKTETFFVPSRVLWPDFGKFFVSEDNTFVHPYFQPNFVVYFLVRDLCVLFPELKSANDTYDQQRRDLIASVVYNLFGPSGVYHYLFGSFIGTEDSPNNSVNFITYVSSHMSKNSQGFWSFDFSDYPAFLDKFDFLRIYSYYRVIAEYYLDENIQKDLMDYIMGLSEDYSVQSNGFMSQQLAKIISKYFSSLLDVTSSTLAATSVLIQANINLLKGFIHRCWPKDYFAGALPFKQAGNAVEIPLQGIGRLELSIGDNMVQYFADNTAINNVSLEVASDQTGVEPGFKRVYLKYQSSDGGTNFDTTHEEPLQTGVTVGGIHTTIENFRTAYQLQEWVEKNARGGTRYKEQIFSHFGVRSKDSRLDRPEFIVGSTDSVNYGNVFTTSQTAKGDDIPAESITAISAGGRSRTGVYRVHEHGYIITFHSIYPRAQYAQGLYRQGFELDKFDYFWPEFQHLGEQEVFMKELMANKTGTFGYNNRYAQYKCRLDTIHGEFVSLTPTFTDYRVLNKNAALNPAFISIIPQFSQLDKIFNYVVADFDKIYVNLGFIIPALRPIDYYGVPRLFI